jgi:hypothetical protein
MHFAKLSINLYFLQSYKFKMIPSISRGTRDFGPAEMQKRQYIFNTLKTNFQW